MDRFSGMKISSSHGSTLLLSVCTVDKSKVEISQNFVAFSEYMNFNARYDLVRMVPPESIFFTKLSGIDPCEKHIAMLGGHAW